jgi:hypothetical protein
MLAEGRRRATPAVRANPSRDFPKKREGVEPPASDPFRAAASCRVFVLCPRGEDAKRLFITTTARGACAVSDFKRSRRRSKGAG